MGFTKLDDDEGDDLKFGRGLMLKGFGLRGLGFRRVGSKFMVILRSYRPLPAVCGIQKTLNPKA